MAHPSRCTKCGAEVPADAPHGLCPNCVLAAGFATDGSMLGATSDVGAAADAKFTPPEPAELAPYFPDLEIIELLGRGGMGMVYKARQKRLDRLVALKILSPQIARDAAFAERFAREARALAMLNHANIVAVHDFGQTSAPDICGDEWPLYYFVMEYVDGMNLRELLDAGRIAPSEALAIVPQICTALQFAHDSGVVHRDIKPENILLSKRGQVKIADFGIAKLMGGGGNGGTRSVPNTSAPNTNAPATDLTAAGQVIGTPQYMAPEQIETPLTVDHRADIYSLGVVFYQMLTGELPTGSLTPPSKKVHIDVRLDEVVLRAMEKEPQRRYQQAGEIKTRVETIITTPHNVGGGGNANSSSHRRDWRTWLMGVGVKSGKKTINWPVLLIQWPLLFVVLCLIWMLNHESSPDIYGRYGFVILSAGIVVFITWIQSLRSVEQLPAIDSPQQQMKRPSESPPKIVSWSWRAVPWQIWVVGAYLVFEGISNLYAIPKNPQAIIWLLAKCLFVLGLFRGWKWVFVLFQLIACIHVAYFLVPNPAGAVMNLILMGLSGSAYRFYFPKTSSKSGRPLWRLSLADLAMLIAAFVFLQYVGPLLVKTFSQSPPAVHSALEELRKTLVAYDLGVDSLSPGRDWTHYDAARLELFPDKNTWPAVLGHIDKDPDSFKIIRKDSQIDGAVNGPNAFMMPLDKGVVTEVYATLLFLKGIDAQGSVVAQSYTSMVCLGKMAGRLHFDSYTTALVKGDVSGRIVSRSYLNLVVTGKFTGRIQADSRAMIYLLGGCEGHLQLNNNARAYIAGRTTMEDLDHINGKAEIYLEESDLPAGTFKTDGLIVTVGRHKVSGLSHGPLSTDKELTQAESENEKQKNMHQPSPEKKVNFVIGPHAFADGDGIVIEEVRSELGTLAKGDVVTVRGSYTLASRAKAKLSFYVTHSRKDSQDNHDTAPYEKSQSISIKAGSGPFELKHRIPYKGHAHISFYPDPSGSVIGTIYFGTEAQMKEIADWNVKGWIEKAGRNPSSEPDEDMQAYLQKTRQLVRRRKYKEALERFIWFHDHALEYDRGMGGVRLSFALSYWKQLGEVYPPAKRAMAEIRDRKTLQLEQGQGTPALFHDVVGLNRTLEETAATVRLFQEIDKSNPALAKKCWHYVKDTLFEQKQYELIRKYIKDPLRQFERDKAIYNLQKATMPDDSRINKPELKQFEDNHFVENCLRLMKLALVNGDGNKAEEIRRRAVKVVDDPRLQETDVLVTSPSTTSTATPPQDVRHMVSDIQETVTAELPKLRFLAWQDERKDWPNGRTWHADGTPVTEKDELRLQGNVLPAGLGFCENTAYAKENLRVLNLWFSHPGFDKQSYKQIELFDAAGKPLPLAASGSFAAGSAAPGPNNDNLGWITCGFSPGQTGNTPKTATIRLQYSAGPWTKGQRIKPDFNGVKGLPGSATLSGIGQNATGKAFVSIAKDKDIFRSPATQISFTATVEGGRELTSSSTMHGSSSASHIMTERIEFDVPLSLIKEFRCHTRPIRSVEFRNVSLQPGQKTDLRVVIPDIPEQKPTQEQHNTTPPSQPPVP